MKTVDLLLKLYETDEVFRDFVGVRAKKMSEAFGNLAAKSQKSKPKKEVEAPPVPVVSGSKSVFPHKTQDLSHREAITLVLKAAGEEGLTNLEIKQGLDTLDHQITQGTLNTVLSELKKLDYLVGEGPRGNSKYYLKPVETNIPKKIDTKIYRSK